MLLVLSLMSMMVLLILSRFSIKEIRGSALFLDLSRSRMSPCHHPEWRNCCIFNMMIT
jgi:hypothetical protein